MTANSAKGHAKPLFPFFPSADQDEGGFSEKWYQELLFENPSLLPASEIEHEFHSLEAVAMELPIGVNWADLLMVNPEGCIVLVETKLFKNSEARREVLAQAIEYACDLSGLTYLELVKQIKKAGRLNPSAGEDGDPLLQIMRGSTQGGTFDEELFIGNVARNLRLGRILLLIVGDRVRNEAARMVEFIHRTPHLHFTLGLIDIALFRESEKDLDAIFVQARVVAKTELHVRDVIEFVLPDSAQIRHTVKHEEPGRPTRTTISEEKFLEELGKVSPDAVELVKWAIENAEEHQLQPDWGAQGVSLKYLDDYTGAQFSFGQLCKDGSFWPVYWLPRIIKLGLPQEIALNYLDDIIGLIPGSYRKEVGYEHELKSQAIFYPHGSQKYLRLEKLFPVKEKWFEAIDRAIGRIREFQERTHT